NRTLLASSSGRGDGLSYYQVVISASRREAELGSAETISEVTKELAEIWPAAREARLVQSRMVTEHRAVFSPEPGCERFRPPQQSPVANLQLAGDWTATGWPATMEGAVRSGYRAAENVLARRGRAERILRPDLPVSWLSRLLLGLRDEYQHSI
ncbi:MAG: FAD-dependent oxidoreductase, partial [Planctomycetes bacterium]|nr:FAD-dependent oxidoreductase [Planctomycetota bacterium]